MTSLYIITRFLTFPGSLVRGFFEQLVCRICGIPVEDNRIVRRDELSGHIEHELFPKSRGAFAVCFVPAFMNGVLAFLLFLCPFVNLFLFEMSGLVSIILSVISYWFAFSLYVNSYPTIEDALNMKEKVYKEGTVLQKIFYAPGFLFLYIGAYAERYCITFLIAVATLIALIMI